VGTEPTSGRMQPSEKRHSAPLDRNVPSAFWARSYYPWLPNGWAVCTCGAEFASRSFADTALTRHERHIVEADDDHARPVR
jgi:hypothetical protein